MNPKYEEKVFVNCPFDKEYFVNLQAIVYTVYRCGFIPLSALGEDNALKNRLSKILDLINQCKFGIHDISRTELNDEKLPRFNMPLELGLFIGASRFGNKDHKRKNALIFEREHYSYQKFISDLNGIDPKAHNNDPDVIIQSIRNWLKTSSGKTTIPGHLQIIEEFKRFQEELNAKIPKLDLELEKLIFNDLCLFVEEFQRAIISKLI